ncbi:hypothetical protein ABZS96_09765 [Streptomyces avermitilis]|uniref:hypothetical protein n=1 Tax=Streptomyces avermitilis TaxID=33903 RepID=UPI0033BCA20F
MPGQAGEVEQRDGPQAVRRPPTDVAPAERGATRIADRVVVKIAAQAAREAMLPLTRGAESPHATVVVHHGTARVRISLELDYPSDIGGQCRAVRRQVAERVGALTGMKVPEVAVQVERLRRAPVPGAAHGRTQ